VKARIRIIHDELRRLRPFLPLALFMLASLWCIPAVAQSYAYVRPTIEFCLGDQHRH